ncbi:MAG: hypothetical protein HOC71_02595 [Candidatus Latescibacteria bacterium]|jgi:hypothetical protein|nr:hypothetical protein [Candidatus Latescibacterota bacterium]
MPGKMQNHDRPIQRFPANLNPEMSRLSPIPVYGNYNVLIQSGQSMRPEQAELFLKSLSGLVYPLSWSIFAVNNGENISVSSQYSVSAQDSALLTSALAASLQGSALVRGTNIHEVLLANIITNENYYRECELELCDIHGLGKKHHWSNNRIFGVASALGQGEALFQDINVFPGQHFRGVAKAFYSSICYGIVAGKGRKERFRKALFGEDEDFYTLSDYFRLGFSWKKIMDMLINKRVYRKALLVPLNHLVPYFVVPWNSPSYKKAGVTIQELQGNKPHPDLYTGLEVGYSLYDNSGRVICIPTDYMGNGSVYICGMTGAGKTALLERLLYPFFNHASKKYSTVVIDYKHELIDHLLGMFDQSTLDSVVYYAPVKFPFKCNIIQGLSTKELVSFLARMVEVRHEYGLTSNAAELLKWAAIAHGQNDSEVTIRHLKAFIADEDYRKAVVRRNPDPEVSDFLKNILPVIPDVSYAAAFSKLESFLSEPLLSSTCQDENRLDFPGLFSEGKHILAELSGLTYEEIADIGTCLFTHASNAAFFRKYDTDDVSVRIVMDEFHTYYHEQLLNNLLNQGRRYNIFSFLAHQSVYGQIDPKTIQNIVGAAKIRICFRVRARDAMFMSSLFGVPAEDLANLNKFEAYLQIDNYPAVKIKTLPPIESSDEIRRQAIELSLMKYGASKIDCIDPYDLFNNESTSQTTANKREYDDFKEK